SNFHLFMPGAGMMFNHWTSDEGQRVGYVAPNAPDGAAIDYFLKSEIKPSKQEKQNRQTPVKIVITDAHGNTVATQYGPSKAGINRFVWNMRYDGARRLRYEAVSQPEPGEPNPSRGPRVLPGTYRIAVTVNGETQSAMAKVLPDPNLNIPQTNFLTQTKAALEARNELSALDDMINRIDEIQNQLKGFENDVEASPNKQLKSKYASILGQAKTLGTKLEAAKQSVWNTAQQHNVEEDDIHQLEDLHGQFADLLDNLSHPYGGPPTPLLLEQMTELRAKLDQQLKAFNALLSSGVVAYNKSAHAAGAPTVFAGEPVTVEPVKLASTQ
ncbi:MAG TPA: hypothetical protein VGY31_14635, partial [Terriglobia bacterium]|nr:hypothetical protein [Terriglobia bacterium]